MNAQEDQTDPQDEENFLITVENTLNIVEKSIHNFIKDIPEALANSGLPLDLEKLNIQDGQKVEDLICSFRKLDTDQKYKEANEKISTLELECAQLRGQLHQQMDVNKKAEEELEYLREQILNQSTYCATLGAVLSNLTWRASRCPEIVEVWLSGVNGSPLLKFNKRDIVSCQVANNLLQFQDKIGELLSITDGSFVAFINTYRNAFPPTCNVEYKFIIGLLGIVTNISATPKGREFLIIEPNGGAFIEKMLKSMPTLPLSQGSLSLKRLMLMISYNVSMNKTGLQLLFELRIGDVLSYYLKNNSLSDEIQFLCLRILQSITYDLTNPKYIQDLITNLPIDKINDIATSNKDEMSTVARLVLKQLRDLRKYIGSN